MAAGRRPLKVQCPSCNNLVSVSDVRGTVVMNCPYCRIKFRISVPPPSPVEPEHPGREARREDEYYDKDLRLFQTLPVIINIVKKDVFRLKFLFIGLFLFGIIFSAALAPVAESIKRENLLWQEELENMDSEERRYEENNRKENELDDIWNSYGLFILISALWLAVLVNYTYGIEVKRGTIRLLSLYPVDMNGLTLAKVISTSIIFGMVYMFVLVFPLVPMMDQNVYPWLSSVLGMNYLINICILVTWAFGSHIITYFTGKLVLGMHRIIGIMLFIYIFLTQTMISGLGLFLIELQNVKSPQAEEMYHNYVLLGQKLGQLSPYHTGGRLLANSYGHNSGGPDLHFVLLIGFILIIAGYFVGKKIYLDVFIKE